MMRQPAELLPGVDLQEIEDEFEQLHRWTFLIQPAVLLLSCLGLFSRNRNHEYLLDP